MPQSGIRTTETAESELESRRCVVFITNLVHLTKHLVKLQFQAVFFRDSMGWWVLLSGPAFLEPVETGGVLKRLPLPSVSPQSRDGDEK